MCCEGSSQRRKNYVELMGNTSVGINEKSFQKNNLDTYFEEFLSVEKVSGFGRVEKSVLF